jgi:cyclophilin family peptidyl-prolyl cis-trans isomerase
MADREIDDLMPTLRYASRTESGSSARPTRCPAVAAAAILLALLVGGCDLSLSDLFGGSEPPSSRPSPASETAVTENAARPVVVIETSKGAIRAELWPDAAPKTVANFLQYVEDGHYDGLIFHRVIPDFMIQGGGFDPALSKKPTRDPIKNEARADVPNARGTLAMARTPIVDSATAQFFINVADNAFLNHEDDTVQGYGYCVFGRVTDGMDVVDEIVGVKTGTRNGMQDVPVEPVVIESIRVAE